MKIAMIGHKRIPSREGGIEIVVEELAVRMAALGHNVTVYNRKGKNVADSEADIEAHRLKSYKGVRLINVFTSQRKSLNAILYSFNATVRALFGHYDVIHFHAEGPCAMLPLAHFFGKRTVATIHGLDWQRSKWGGFATRFLKYGEKMAAKYADELIVLSQNVQQYFLDTYGRETVFVPNGVNIEDSPEPVLIGKEYGLKKDGYILFLARLVPEKGLHYLLEAYSGIDTKMPLVIAGGASHSGDYVDEIKKLAASDSRVLMTGFVQGRKLKELMGNCALYVLPSDIEGMPISLLEAMSFGRCCLVSDISENTDAAGGYAMSFKKSDVSDLKAKLELFLEEREEGANGIGRVCSENKKSASAEADRPAGGDAVIAFVRKNYDWDAVTARTLELYAGHGENKL